MNIITKLKNIRKKAQREVSAWRRQNCLGKLKFMSRAGFHYQDTIDDIADMVSIYECKQIGISADWKELNSFLLLNMVRPRQLSRLASAAKKKSRLVKLSELTCNYLPDLRKVTFV